MHSRLSVAVVAFVTSTSIPAFAEPVGRLVLRSLRTDAPVVDARVVVEGVSYELSSDEGGAVPLSPEVIGRAAAITAKGYLGPRLVTLRRDMDERLQEDDRVTPWWYVYRMVYHGEPTGILRRPVTTRVVVEPDDRFCENARARAALGEAVAIVNDADEDIAWVMRESHERDESRRLSSRDLVVLVRLDPTDTGFAFFPHAGALAYISDKDGEIVSALIVLRDPGVFPGAHLRRALAHELGHVRGLDEGWEGMMGSPEPVAAFSVAERLVMRYLMARPPGTRPLDDSRDGVVAAFGARPRTRLVCVF